jgi:hypothetical protein
LSDLATMLSNTLDESPCFSDGSHLRATSPAHAECSDPRFPRTKTKATGRGLGAHRQSWECIVSVNILQDLVLMLDIFCCHTGAPPHGACLVSRSDEWLQGRRKVAPRFRFIYLSERHAARSYAGGCEEQWLRAAPGSSKSRRHASNSASTGASPSFPVHVDDLQALVGMRPGRRGRHSIPHWLGLLCRCGTQQK